MPLNTEFTVLIVGYSKPPSSKHRCRNMIVADKFTDILTLIETTQFDLILLDLAADCPDASAPNQLQDLCPTRMKEIPRTDENSLVRHRHLEFIARIKDPLGINNKTPVIAVMNPAEMFQEESQYPIEFDDRLIKPITEDRLNEIIDLWQTKALALDYIQIILSRTKNNRPLTLTIFEKLFEELPLQIVDIKKALENKHYALAQEITHKLNGSASFCGLSDIQRSASDLEKNLLNNNYADINQHFLTLEQYTLNLTCLQNAILANLGKC